MPLVAGIAGGLVGAAAASRFLQGMLYGIAAFDLVAFAAAVATLLAVTLAAALIRPGAWRRWIRSRRFEQTNHRLHRFHRLAPQLVVHHSSSAGGSSRGRWPDTSITNG